MHTPSGPFAKEGPLPPALALAFAPLHKRAFGVAVGTALAVLVFWLTVMVIFRRPAHGPNLWLLTNYFAGYSVSWPGAVIGAGWGFVTGFVAGWFFAFCRNLVIAVTVFLVRTRAELNATQDFLDHI